jgi:hypothetical protein
MVTGDNRRTTEAIAHKLGIDEIEAEVLPPQKAEIVRRLQAHGRSVAMGGMTLTMHLHWRKPTSVWRWVAGLTCYRKCGGDARPRQPVRHCPSQAAESRDHAQNPPKLVLCIRLQQLGRSPWGGSSLPLVWTPAQSNDSKRDHEPQFHIGD